MLFLFRSVMPYLKRSKLLFLFMSATLFCELCFEYVTSLSIKYLIDGAIAGGDYSAFYLILGVLVASGLLTMAIGITGDYILAKLSEKMVLGMRSRLYGHIQTLSVPFYSRYRIGDIVARYTVDIPAVEYAFRKTLNVGIFYSASCLVGITLMFSIDWRLALVGLLAIPLMLLPQRLLNKPATASNEAYVAELESFSNHMDEEVKNYKLIHGFNLKASMSKRFNEQMERWYRLGIKKNFINSNIERLPLMVVAMLNVAILGLGGFFTMRGDISVGDYIAFHTIFNTVTHAAFSILEVTPGIIGGKVSMRRIQELLDIRSNIGKDSAAAPLPAIDGGIHFNDVSFGFAEGHPVIKEINMEIPAGSSVALVGTSGSGKSTLLQLLLRFYDPQQGAITVGGADLRTIETSSLLDKIGVAYQESYLLQGTIRDNLLIGNPAATDDQLTAAAKAADVHDSIMGMEQGYDTIIENDGSNLSAGQRHQIALARTLLRNPQLLVLDEITASLDPGSESAVLHSIDRIRAGRTMLTATNRLSNVVNADRIYVLDGGRLADSGKHQELMERRGKYYELWRKQHGFRITGNEVQIDVDRLRQMSFFEQISDDDLAHITQLFSTTEAVAGQHIVRQGELGDTFYIIVRGKVEIMRRTSGSRDASRIAILEDGDHFGELALMNKAPRNADVRALTPCILLTLTHDKFNALLMQHDSLRHKLMQIALQRA